MSASAITWVARGLAAANAAYQGAVGVLSLVSPTTAGAIYDVAEVSSTSAALIRILGGVMVGNAFVLGVFAHAPRRNPALPWLLLLASVAGVTANVVACGAGELRWVQVAGSTAFQTALATSLAAYVARAR